MKPNSQRRRKKFRNAKPIMDPKLAFQLTLQRQQSKDIETNHVATPPTVPHETPQRQSNESKKSHQTKKRVQSIDLLDEDDSLGQERSASSQIDEPSNEQAALASIQRRLLMDDSSPTHTSPTQPSPTRCNSNEATTDNRMDLLSSPADEQQHDSSSNNNNENGSKSVIEGFTATKHKKKKKHIDDSPTRNLNETTAGTPMGVSSSRVDQQQYNNDSENSRMPMLEESAANTKHKKKKKEKKMKHIDPTHNPKATRADTPMDGPSSPVHQQQYDNNSEIEYSSMPVVEESTATKHKKKKKKKKKKHVKDSPTRSLEETDTAVDLSPSPSRVDQQQYDNNSENSRMPEESTANKHKKNKKHFEDSPICNLNETTTVTSMDPSSSPSRVDRQHHGNNSENTSMPVSEESTVNKKKKKKKKKRVEEDSPTPNLNETTTDTSMDPSSSRRMDEDLPECNQNEPTTDTPRDPVNWAYRQQHGNYDHDEYRRMRAVEDSPFNKNIKVKKRKKPVEDSPTQRNRKETTTSASRDLSSSAANRHKKKKKKKKSNDRYQEALQSIDCLRMYELEQQKQQTTYADDEMPKPLDFNVALLRDDDDSNVVWHYDAKNRVVRADCSNVISLGTSDVAKLAYLMERDDLVLITKGLFMALEDIDEFLAYIASNDNMYHKFRRFEREDGTNDYTEVDGYVDMRPAAYVEYLQKFELERPSVVEYQRNGEEEFDDVHDVRFYMVDVDISVLYPQLHRAYEESCKWKDVLPGGKLCMMGEMPKQMQPFMGPNLYLTPGATYTSLHQDGFGSVDSGHSNLYGTNEVIMLRRLPERHKKRACQVLNVDALYRMPHDDADNTQQRWPTHDDIEEWDKSNYVPSRFLLYAGEHVHINKGRLHAFRKLTNEPLPESDCHSELRHEFLRNHTIERDICVSIAYDWMYLGFQASAIQDEIVAVLEAARQIRAVENAKTLAVGETAIFTLAETIAAESLDFSSRSVTPDKKAIAVGICRALMYLVYRDETKDRKAIAPIDADEDPSYRATDPYGNDYVCKLCYSELSNTYFHCQGCEELLQMDFNICLCCFAEKKYRTNVEMKPYAIGKIGCHLHHIASRRFNQCTSRHSGGSSDSDRLNCACHRKFLKRHRFRSAAATRKLLEKCMALAGEEKPDFDAAQLEGAAL